MVAGLLTGGLALAGFGLDSVIEVASAAVLIWRLCKYGEIEAEQKAERPVLFLVGISLVALAPYGTPPFAAHDNS